MEFEQATPIEQYSIALVTIISSWYITWPSVLATLCSSALPVSLSTLKSSILLIFWQFFSYPRFLVWLPELETSLRNVAVLFRQKTGIPL